MGFYLHQSCKPTQVPQVCAGALVRYSLSMRASVTVQISVDFEDGVPMSAYKKRACVRRPVGYN